MPIVLREMRDRVIRKTGSAYCRSHVRLFLVTMLCLLFLFSVIAQHFAVTHASADGEDEGVSDVLQYEFDDPEIYVGRTGLFGSSSYTHALVGRGFRAGVLFPSGRNDGTPIIAVEFWRPTAILQTRTNTEAANVYTVLAIQLTDVVALIPWQGNFIPEGMVDFSDAEWTVGEWTAVEPQNDESLAYELTFGMAVELPRYPRTLDPYLGSLNFNLRLSFGLAENGTVSIPVYSVTNDDGVVTASQAGERVIEGQSRTVNIKYDTILTFNDEAPICTAVRGAIVALEYLDTAATALMTMLRGSENDAFINFTTPLGELQEDGNIMFADNDQRVGDFAWVDNVRVDQQSRSAVIWFDRPVPFLIHHNVRHRQTLIYGYRADMGVLYPGGNVLIHDPSIGALSHADAITQLSEPEVVAPDLTWWLVPCMFVLTILVRRKT